MKPNKTTPNSWFKRPSTWIPAVAILLLGVRTVLNIRRDYDAGDQNAVGNHLLILGSVIAIVAIVMWLVSLLNARVPAAASHDPSAVVLHTTSQGARSQLRQLIRQQTASNKRMYIPVFLALKADNVGIELWGGLRTIRVIFAQEWHQISHIEAVHIAGSSSTFRGLAFTVVGPEASTVMPLIITGSGPFGLMSLSQKRLDVALAALQQLRSKSDAS